MHRLNGPRVAIAICAPDRGEWESSDGAPLHLWRSPEIVAAAHIVRVLDLPFCPIPPDDGFTLSLNLNFLRMGCVNVIRLPIYWRRQMQLLPINWSITVRNEDSIQFYFSSPQSRWLWSAIKCSDFHRSFPFDWWERVDTSTIKWNWMDRT